MCVNLSDSHRRTSALTLDPLHVSVLQSNVTLLSMRTPEELAVSTQREIQSLLEPTEPTARLQRDKSKKGIPTKTSKVSSSTTDKKKLKRSEPYVVHLMVIDSV